MRRALSSLARSLPAASSFAMARCAGSRRARPAARTRRSTRAVRPQGPRARDLKGVARLEERVRLLDELRLVTGPPPQSASAPSNIRIRLLWHKKDRSRNGGWITVSSPGGLPPVLAPSGDDSGDDSEQDDSDGNGTPAEGSGAHGHADIAAEHQDTRLGEKATNSQLACHAATTLEDSGCSSAACVELPSTTSVGAAPAFARDDGFTMAHDGLRAGEWLHAAAARAAEAATRAAEATARAREVMLANDAVRRAAPAFAALPPTTNRRSSRAVEQLDLKTNAVINRFESAIAAARTLAGSGSERTQGTLVVYIREALKGRREEAGGFRWRYLTGCVEDYVATSTILRDISEPRGFGLSFPTRIAGKPRGRPPKGKQWCSVTRQWVPESFFASNVYQNRARLAAAQAASLCGGAAAPWMASAKDVELAAQRTQLMAVPEKRLPQPFELRHAGPFEAAPADPVGADNDGGGGERVHEAAATSLRALAMSLATTSRAIARSDGQSLLSNLPRASSRAEGDCGLSRLADPPALAASIAPADTTRLIATAAAAADTTGLADNLSHAATVAASANVMRLAAATAAAPDDATRFTQEETLRTATAELSELVRAQKAAAAAALADATRFASNPVLAVTAAALADVTPALLAHAQSSHSATARRAYRKELITKQRLAGKTGKHTHYEYRRQAANERTRVAGRFQKKNQGEATMNERTPEEVRGERKAANKRALAPEEDRGERKEDAPLDGTADYLVRLHKAPRTSPLAVPAFPGLLPPDPGPAVPGLLFHYSKMSNGMSQPPASGALREPASSLGTSRTHAAPAPRRENGLRLMSPLVFHVAVPIEPPPRDATIYDLGRARISPGPGWEILGEV